MRKKYTLLILLLAGTSMAAMAQNGGRSINVLYLDGSDHNEHVGCGKNRNRKR